MALLFCSCFLHRETAAGDQSEVWSRFPQIAAMGEGMSRQLQLTQEIARMKKILEAKTQLEKIQKQIIGSANGKQEQQRIRC